MKSKNGDKPVPHLTRGNVLDDLGFNPAESLEIKVKAELYRDLLDHIKKQGCSQLELCSQLGIHQPDASNLLSGKVSKFSVGRLIQFASKLHLDAEVRLTPKRPNSASPAAPITPPKRRTAVA